MKYAFVTGAAGGIAQAVTMEIDKLGDWTIFAADMAPMDDTVAKCSDRVIPMTIDISDMDSVQACVDEVKKYTDTVNAIFNIAGFHTMASLVEGDPIPILEKIVNVNTLGMARVNAAFFNADLLKGKESRIINFSSENGWEQPQPFNTPYALSKWGVEAYTIGLRRELNFLDIPVVKVQPGSFKTGMHGQATNGYEKLLASTTHYVPVLKVLAPIMTVALSSAHDMHYITDACIDALTAKKPKQNYRVKNTWYLGLMDPIPGQILDPAYKVFVGGLYKVMSALGKV